jgi:serine/threonine-protein kinase
VSIGPNTSCGFAETVAHAYDRTAGGTQAISAYSQAAGRTYTIDCRGGSPVACTGGTTVGAAIYFPYTPASQSGGANLTACDPNIAVNSVTSCPFAENVFKAYADQYNGNRGQANAVVSASSPVTNKTYSMNCANNGATVTCTGGINSYVTFPLHAAQVY